MTNKDSEYLSACIKDLQATASTTFLRLIVLSRARPGCITDGITCAKEYLPRICCIVGVLDVCLVEGELEAIGDHSFYEAIKTHLATAVDLFRRVKTLARNAERSDPSGCDDMSDLSLDLSYELQTLEAQLTKLACEIGLDSMSLTEEDSEELVDRRHQFIMTIESLQSDIAEFRPDTAEDKPYSQPRRPGTPLRINADDKRSTSRGLPTRPPAPRPTRTTAVPAQQSSEERKSNDGNPFMRPGYKKDRTTSPNPDDLKAGLDLPDCTPPEQPLNSNLRPPCTPVSGIPSQFISSKTTRMPTFVSSATRGAKLAMQPRTISLESSQPAPTFGAPSTPRGKHARPASHAYTASPFSAYADKNKMPHRPTPLKLKAATLRVEHGKATAEGTKPKKKIVPGPDKHWSTPRDSTDVDTTVFFDAEDG